MRPTPRDPIPANGGSQPIGTPRVAAAVAPARFAVDEGRAGCHNGARGRPVGAEVMGEAANSSLPEPPPRTVTRLLDGASRGDREATGAVLPLVYKQLRALAQQQLANERHAHTLQATALVHEAYLRLVGDEPVSWAGRGHFYAAAAEAMRRILIDHARRRGAVKRGRDWTRGAARLDDLTHEENLGDLLALDEAVSRLAAAEPRAAQVVKLRFFAGMSVDQIAQVMDISPRTVDRVWMFARAWLLDDLQGGAATGLATGGRS